MLRTTIDAARRGAQFGSYAPIRHLMGLGLPRKLDAEQTLPVRQKQVPVVKKTFSRCARCRTETALDDETEFASCRRDPEYRPGAEAPRRGRQPGSASGETIALHTASNLRSGERKTCGLTRL